MALMTDPPVITISGEPLPASWTDGRGLVGVADLAMPWGRDDPFGEPEPTTLSMTVIDPDGAWSTDNDLVGAPIVVERPAPTVRAIFRGRINDVQTRRGAVTDPITGREVTVWFTAITAASTQADLAQAVMPGPVNDPDGIGYGNGYWPPTATPGERLDDVFENGASTFIDGIEHFPGAAMLKGHQYSEGLNLFDLIALAYRSANPLTHANYVPHTNRIDFGRAAVGAGLRLTWLDGLVVTEATGNGLTVPASRVALASDQSVRSTVANAIDIVQVAWATAQPDAATTGRWNTDALATAYTARYDPAARGQRVYKIDTDIRDDGAPANAVAASSAVLINEINGKFALPPIRFLPGRLDYDAAALDVLLATYDKPLASFYFRGSIFAGLNNVGPLFQIVGGTVSWSARGWAIDANAVPAAEGPDPTTWDQVAPAAVTYDDLDPAITLRELAYVTEGVPD
ncbi:hypothetical protein HQQ81_05620 [Microbacteriaceae bacterium VKM Ac-2854]|nr:hypothetical protein [Microbacteriaceae bacterium VKM Ac-2854]